MIQSLITYLLLHSFNNFLDHLPCQRHWAGTVGWLILDRSQEVGVSCRHLLLAYTLFCWWTYLRCGVRDVRRKLHWRRQLVSGGQCSSASFPGAVRVPLAVTFFNPWSRMAMMNFYNSVVSSVIPASLPSWLWQVRYGGPVFKPHLQFFQGFYIIPWFDCFAS